MRYVLIAVLVVAVALIAVAGRVGPVERALSDEASREARDDARSCDRGDVPACSNLGVRYEAGDGVPVDADRAEALYRQACDDGGGLACANLAALLSSRGGAADASIALLEAACTEMDAIPCLRLAEALVLRGAPGDAASAAAHFARLCDGYVMPGCVGLGDLHASGSLGEADLHAAASAWMRACEREYPRGCMGLAGLELRRPVDERDAARALQWYERACFAGEADSCVMAADALLLDAPDLPADPARADELRQRACSDGFDPACPP